MNSSVISVSERFSTVYVEKEVLSHPRTKRILSHLPKAEIIPVARYMDIFSRPRQVRSLQQKHQALILAAKHGQRIYPGAPVCQDFGSESVVCSCVLNCLYDCSYCWLKGMFDTAHIAVFVNLEDFFRDVEEVSEKKSISLSLAYQSDLVPLEGMLGILKEWDAFVQNHPRLLVEIRTKSAFCGPWQEMRERERVVPAFTLSPEEVIAEMEKGTPPLAARLQAVRTCQDIGYRPRLCFDPMMHMPSWRQVYSRMFAAVVREVDFSRIREVSLGTFRLSAAYLSRLRRQVPDAPAARYPYVTDAGYAHYPRELEQEMMNLGASYLGKVLPSEKIHREEYV
jgi:spore photoproduct lyase